MVDVLAANSGRGTLAVSRLVYTPLILEQLLLSKKSPLCGIGITVVKLAMLDSTELSSVLLGKNLAVLDGLNSAVVVVLVDLLVDCGQDLFVLVRLDDLVLDSRGNCLMDGGVVVSRLGHEVGDCCLGRVS